MFNSHKIFTLLLTATLVSSPLLRADFKSDIDFNKLRDQYGASLPTGEGVRLAQIEYLRGGSWSPSATGELSGKTITYNCPVNVGTSGHANEVAAFLLGSNTSITPGVTSLDAFEATSYLASCSLNGATFSAPMRATWDVENHSWGGMNSFQFINQTRRLDHRIDSDNVISIVGIDNSRTLSLLLAQGYNAITVGSSTGEHPTTGSTYDVPGRRKPDLVGTATWTSYAAPIVTSCATLLVGKINSDPALAPARNPRVIKAILMAGATKSEFPNWSRTTSTPLDTTYGAGEVNIYNSYHILTAGQKLAASTAHSTSGWDLSSTSSGPTRYRITVPAGKRANLSSILTWHRRFNAPTVDFHTNWFAFNPLPLANLDLTLNTADQAFSPVSEVTRSASAIDNVEHVYATQLSAGNYLLEIASNTADERYGIAWSLELTDDPNSTDTPPPPPLPAPSIFSFDAASPTLIEGYSTTLNWSTSGATSASISPSVGDVSGLSTTTVSPSSTTTYSLTATNTSGSVSRSLTVTVNPAPVPPPSIFSFDAASPTLIEGYSTTLNWSTFGATSVSISPTVGDVSGLSTTTVSPSSTTTYILTATNTSGSVSRSLTVTVNPAPIPAPAIQSFTVSPASLPAGGGNATFTWSASHASSFSLSSIGNVSGNSYTAYISSTADLTLTATNASGSATASTTVFVSAPVVPPPAPIAPPPAVVVPPTSPVVDRPSPTEVVFGLNQTSSILGTFRNPGETSYDAASDILTLKFAGNDIFYGSMRFASMPASGDFEISTRILGFDTTNSTAKAGLMVKGTATTNPAHATLVVTPLNMILFYYRQADGSSNNARYLITATRPLALKLCKNNNVVTALYTLDGQAWGTLGSVDLALPVTSQVGAVYSTFKTDVLSGAQFGQTRLCLNTTAPSHQGLALYNIGTTTEAASAPAPATTSSSTLRALGTPTANGKDSQAYLAKTHSGDGSISCELASFSPDAPVWRAGLMFRETLTDNSARVFFGYNAGGQLFLETRGPGINSSQSFDAAGRHLILERRGNTFTALASHDGNQWNIIGTTTVSTRVDLWAGLTACSQVTTTPVEVTFNGFIETF